MSLHALNNDHFRLVVSTLGGSILALQAKAGGALTPLLRSAVEAESTPPLGAGCFPLMPFGNRVRDNVFTFACRDYRLSPNVDWDPHYVHGDAWLGQWSVLAEGERYVELGYEHLASAGIYGYVGTQRFELDGDSLRITLGVTNRGTQALPFGLGWHPYFALDGDTTLQAPATGYWTEGDRWLPEAYCRPPRDLDFSLPRHLPGHWVNNGFDGWNGEAWIRWPSRQLALRVRTPCSRYFVFVSDTQFDPAFRHDFFCFEPMSHAADAHNSPDLGGLVVLAAQESMSLAMTMQLHVTA